jgi:hypothetical protein
VTDVDVYSDVRFSSTVCLCSPLSLSEYYEISLMYTSPWRLKKWEKDRPRLIFLRLLGLRQFYVVSTA